MMQVIPLENPYELYTLLAIVFFFTRDLAVLQPIVPQSFIYL